MISPDGFEQVRDQIAAILAAYFAANDPSVGLYIESSRPWEGLRDSNDLTVVNVAFDGDNDDPAGGNPVQDQKMIGNFHVDVIASAVSRDGQPGDRAAAFKVQELARTARAVLMAAENTYLQRRGLVWSRRVTSRQMLNAQKVSQVFDLIACRLTVQVVYNEVSPQIEPVQIEGIDLTVDDQTGRVVITGAYNYGS